MPPPSQLSITTSSVLRLIKEELSYHKELQQQESRLQRVQQDDGDENKEYIIQQEKRAMEETKAVFPSLRERIREATEKLEEQLEAEKDKGDQSNAEEITKAKEAVAQASTSYRKIA